MNCKNIIIIALNLIVLFTHFSEKKTIMSIQIKLFSNRILTKIHIHNNPIYTSFLPVDDYTIVLFNELLNIIQIGNLPYRCSLKNSVKLYRFEKLFFRP